MEKIICNRGDGLYEVEKLYVVIDGNKFYYLTKDGFLSKIVWLSDNEKFLLEKDFEKQLEKRNDEIKKLKKKNKLGNLDLLLKLVYNPLFKSMNEKEIKLEKIYYDLPIYDGENVVEFEEKARFFRYKDLVKLDCGECQMGLYSVKIDKNYVEKYLIVEKRGIVIESHNFCQIFISKNRDNMGFLVLGKRVGNEIHLAGFKIPYGCGIYIPSFVYHSDSYLVGEYNVSLSISQNYEIIKFTNIDLDTPIRFMPLFL